MRHTGAVRSVGWRAHASGSDASAAQVSATARLTGAWRHGQAVLTGRRVLQTWGGTGAHAWDRHGKDDGGRADRHVLRVSDTAKETVRVRVASTARRWRGGRTQSRNRAFGLGGQGRAARAQRMVVGVEGRHGEEVEGRVDGRVLQT